MRFKKRSRSAEQQAEALQRATTNQALTNYPAIYDGFVAMGIPEADIQPRVNVFTYDAWKALGRQVRKGEHGVRVCTFVECTKTVRDPATGAEQQETFRRPWTTTVFHITQTDPRN